MALIICPECKQEISDQAKNCPKCGFPLQVEEEEHEDIENEISNEEVNTKEYRKLK